MPEVRNQIAPKRQKNIFSAPLSFFIAFSRANSAGQPAGFFCSVFLLIQFPADGKGDSTGKKKNIIFSIFFRPGAARGYKSIRFHLHLPLKLQVRAKNLSLQSGVQIYIFILTRICTVDAA